MATEPEIDDHTFFPMVHLLDSPFSNYLKQVLPQYNISKLIVGTRIYQDLPQYLVDAKKILLKGPKGSGKTTALIYLAQQLTQDNSVFKNKFQQVLLYSTDDKSNCLSRYMLETLGSTLDDAINLTTTVVLIELGSYSSDKEQAYWTAVEYGKMCPNVVIAFSGGGYMTKGISLSLSGELAEIEDSFKIIQISGLTTAEAYFYVTKCKEKTLSITEMTNLQLCTNWNPYLLDMFVSLKTNYALDLQLTRVKSHFIRSLLSSIDLGASLEGNYSPSLAASIYVYKKASESCLYSDLEFSVQSRFTKLFVVLEAFVKVSDNELLLAHPFLYRHIMNELIHKQQTLDQDEYMTNTVKGIINGHWFEQYFSSEVIQKTISFRVFCATTGKYETNQIHVKDVSTCFQPLKDYEDDVLYLLRPEHPVIDMVGKFGKTVYMIQLSLQLYQNHRTKSGDLFRNFQFEFLTDTILMYYTKLFGITTANVIYVYISPQENLQSDPSKLVPNSNDSQQLDLKVGFLNAQNIVEAVKAKLPYNLMH